MVLLQGWRFHVLPGDSDYDVVKMMEEACAIRTNLKQADIIIFTGGTDVNPTLYGEKRISQTQTPDLDRDTFETKIYHAAYAKKKHLIGICRGAQLLNALNGGGMWQHIDGHKNCVHPMLYVNAKSEKFIVPVTSDHHQMMVPTEHAKIWGRSSKTTFVQGPDFRRFRHTKHNDDIEVVFYPETKSLCFQPHPEWGLISCRELFMDCVQRSMIEGSTK